MKATKTLIAWVGAEQRSRRDRVPAGSLAVGRLLTDKTMVDWAADYNSTGGAAYTFRHKLSAPEQRFHVLADYRMLTYDYGLHPYVVHRAFLAIDEYQEIIKELGFGPAKDEPGHDPNVGHGRAIGYPLPRLKIHDLGHSLHVWPMPEDSQQSEESAA